MALRDVWLYWALWWLAGRRRGSDEAYLFSRRMAQIMVDLELVRVQRPPRGRT